MTAARRPSVLITTDFAAPHRNGVAQVVANITAGLPDCDITILTYAQPGEPQRSVTGPVTTIRIPARRYLGDTLRFPAGKLTIPKHDLVITNTRFFTLSAVGMRLAKTWGVPRIHLEHGNRHVPHHNPLIRVAAWGYDQSIGRAVVSRADMVVCIARAGLPFARKLGARKVTLIPNGIDTKPFQLPASKAALVRQELGIAPTERMVLFVGRLVREKGVQDLLNALAHLPGTSSWVLVIIGNGPARASLEAQAKRANIRTIFLGELPPEHLPPYYKAADLFVNPSWAEGLPLTVLEATAAGTPVIATAVGGTVELLAPESLIKARDPQALQAALARSSTLPRSTFPVRYSLQFMHAAWHSLVFSLLPKHFHSAAASTADRASPTPRPKSASAPAPQAQHVRAVAPAKRPAKRAAKRTAQRTPASKQRLPSSGRVRR